MSGLNLPKNNFVWLVQLARISAYISISEGIVKNMLVWCDHRQNLEIAKFLAILLFPKFGNISNKQKSALVRPGAEISIESCLAPEHTKQQSDRNMLCKLLKLE